MILQVHTCTFVHPVSVHLQHTHRSGVRSLPLYSYRSVDCLTSSPCRVQLLFVHECSDLYILLRPGCTFH